MYRAYKNINSQCPQSFLHEISFYRILPGFILYRKARILNNLTGNELCRNNAFESYG